MKEFLHRLAAVGNSAALVLVVLFVASAGVLLDERPTPVPDRRPAVRVAPASRVVLVVIDGLRDDTASDPRVMPNLTDLARRGGRTTAAVESLVPSTIAGLTTLAAGRVPPPASFLEDFRSRPSRDGGIFAAVAARGGRSFVAGPPLWTDRYGAWIAGAYAAPALGEDDEGVLRAGLDALGRAEDQLVVLHFARPDEAAHLHGGRSPEYAAEARRCDEAVRQLAARLGPGDRLLVTSDHGVTDRGGHAGREADVVRTPVVWYGPGAAPVELPPLRQRDVPVLIAAALGLSWSPDVPPAGSGAVGRLLILTVGGAIALGSAVRLWSALVAGATGRPQAFYLNLAVWVALGLVVAGWRAAAAGLSVAVLLACAAGPVTGRLCRLLGGCVVLGAAAGVARIAAEPWAARAAAGFGAVADAAPLVAAVAAVGCGVAIGRVLRRRASTGGPDRGARSAAVAGSVAAVAAVALHYLTGQTLSLSSLDVRTAYRLTHLPLGLPLAVAAVVLIQALPVVGLALGARRVVRSLPPGCRCGFLAGFMAVPVGGTAAAAAVLGAWPGHGDLSALALAGFLRSGADVIYVAAALLLVSAGSGARRSGTIG